MRGMKRFLEHFLETFCKVIMTLLTLLTEILCVEVLTKWCEKEDLCKLDSAVCNGISRKYLLQLFSSKQFILPSGANQNTCIPWIVRRKLKLNRLSLSENYSFMHNIPLFDLNFSEIESMKLSGFGDKSPFEGPFLLHMINCSKKLQSFEVFYVGIVNDIVIRKIETNILSQLTHIDIQNSQISDKTVHHLGCMCKNLEKLVLSISYQANASENAFLSLLQNNSKLKHIDICCVSFSALLLNTTAQHCSLIEYFRVHSYPTEGSCTLADITNMITKCKMLSTLIVTSQNKKFMAISTYPLLSSGAMKTLLISSYSNTTHNADLEAFFSTVPGFTKVEFHLFDYETNSSLADVINVYSPNLKEFKLYYCSVDYSDQSSFLKQLLTVSKNLKTVEIVGPNSICDDGGWGAFSVEHELKQIKLSCCYYLNLDILRYLLNYCPLARFHIYRDTFTDEDSEEDRNNWNELKHFYDTTRDSLGDRLHVTENKDD